jgi:hypothetical protein
VHLYLLLAGLRIVYGGALQPEFSQTTNFTQRLFDLVGAYSGLASSMNANLKPILNLPPWPVWLKYNDKVKKLFGKLAELTKGDRPTPKEVPETDAELFPPEKTFKELPDTPERRLAWTRGLTRMRVQTTEIAHARLVIGGKLTGFSGLYPGVVEEAWMSIVCRKPLFLIGAFGGATRALIDLLHGRDRPDLTSAGLASTVPNYSSLIKLAKLRGLESVEASTSWNIPPLEFAGMLAMPDRIVHDVQFAGTSGPAKALNNGLTDVENNELFRALDPPRIAELVLTGLGRLT